MNPMWRARHAASARSDRLVVSVSPTRIDPRDGRSMPASRFSSVDLPEPDGPINPRNSPSGTWMVTRSSTGISFESRLYDFETSRSSISAMSLSLETNQRAIDEPGRWIENQRLARHDAAFDLDLIEPLLTERHRPARRDVAVHYPDDRLIVLLRHGPLRNEHDRRLRRARFVPRFILAPARLVGGFVRLLEGHARGHLRLHVRVGVEDADADFDDRFRAIGRRKNLAQPSLVGTILIRLQFHFRGHRADQFRDAVLADLGLNLELRQIRDRGDRTAFARRLSGDAERRHRLANLRALPDHDAVERRADVGVLERLFDDAHAGARRGDRRLRRLHPR